MKKIITTAILSFNICFLSFAQLQNSSFENWNQGLPNGWFAALIPGYPIVVQSTDAHTGAYSVQLNVVNINGNPYGSSISTGSVNGFTTPINYVPSSINFWYKLNAVSGDQLSVLALVYSAGNLVALGSMQSNTATVYTPASFTLLNLGGGSSADSIQVSFLINNPAGGTHIGSSANIDDVNLALPSGINTLNNVGFTLSPNPVKDQLNLHFENKNLQAINYTIYDVAGKKIVTRTVNTNSSLFSINTTDLKNGIYFLSITANDESFSKRFVIEK